MTVDSAPKASRREWIGRRRLLLIGVIGGFGP